MKLSYLFFSGLPVAQSVACQLRKQQSPDRSSRPAHSLVKGIGRANPAGNQPLLVETSSV